MRKPLVVFVCVIMLLSATLSLSAQKGAPSFDQCYEDDGGNKYLKVASASAHFDLSDCAGFDLSGQGTLTTSGQLKLLRFDIPVVGGFLKGRFQIDTGAGKASGFVWDSSINATVFTLDDAKFKGNVCACSP